MALRKIGFTELVTAIYTRLTTDDLTSDYDTYDYVPNNATLPYISISSPIGTRSASFSAQDTPAQDNIVMIHVWSDYKGTKECADMLDDIAQALDGTALSITGYTPVIAHLDYTDIIIDGTEPARPIRHGVLRFRVHMA